MLEVHFTIFLLSFSGMHIALSVGQVDVICARTQAEVPVMAVMVRTLYLAPASVPTIQALKVNK